MLSSIAHQRWTVSRICLQHFGFTSDTPTFCGFKVGSLDPVWPCFRAVLGLSDGRQVLQRQCTCNALIHSYWLSRSIESKTPSSTTFYENSPLDRTFGAFWSWHDLACLDAIGRLGI